MKRFLTWVGKVFVGIVLWLLVLAICGVIIAMSFTVVGVPPDQHTSLTHPTLFAFGAIGALLAGPVFLRIVWWAVLVRFTAREWAIGMRSVEPET